MAESEIWGIRGVKREVREKFVRAAQIQGVTVGELASMILSNAA